MAISYVRYDGSIANAEVDIVAAVTNPHLLFSIILHNSSGSPASAEVLLKAGAGTPRTIINQTAIAAGATVTFDAKMTLEATDAIRAVSDTNAVIVFWISAAEIT